MMIVSILTLSIVGLIGFIIGVGVLAIGICIKSDKYCKAFVFLGIFIVCVSFVPICVISAVSPNGYSEETLVKTTNLYSLGSGTGVHGKFIAGTGTVDDIQYYLGYTNIDDKQYCQVKFDASKSVLILDDNETPRVEMYSLTPYNVVGYFIVEKDAITLNKIYIPTDGIEEEFKVN